MTLRCLVVTVARNSKGQPIRSGKVVEGDPLTIGRSPEASVYLPDPRVHRRHAIIESADAGKVQVVAQDADIDVNGELRSRVELVHAERVLIGPYRITAEPATGPDHDFAVAVELVQPFPADMADVRGRSRTSLGATWLSKRGLVWTLFGAVALIGIGLPLAWATSPRFRSEARIRFPGPLKSVAWDAAWDPGPLSRAHQPLAQRCDACHQVPFAPVQDRTCVTCHEGTGPHARDGSAPLGDSLGARCAECHRDHGGEAAGAQTDPRFCANCHGEIQVRRPGSRLGNVTDFAVDHPPLSLSILNRRSGVIERVPEQDWKWSGQASGLKFPHAVHLAKGGVRGPSGVRVLECSQCHTLDSANVRFEPIKMAAHCSECHRLDFEPGVANRQAPHGDPANVLTTLRDFYSRVALAGQSGSRVPVDGLLRRPVEGAPPAEGERSLAWADRKAEAVAIDLVEHRVCAQCHEVSRTRADEGAEGAADSGPRWAIQPVRITSRWLPGVDFDHQSHRPAACERCHDVRSSRSSADIAMPTIATCRSCHTGAIAVKGMVRSPCETCHTFHQPSRTLATALATGSEAPR